MNKQVNRVSILGCGWLGLPLAEHLVQAGYQVKGSTTTPQKMELLQSKNIQPALINLAENPNPTSLKEFLNTDCLIISFPPRLRAGKEQIYLPQIQVLATALQQSPVKQVIFISSTSVYRDVNRIVTEEDETALLKDSPLYQAEILLQQNTAYKTVILRFGGLVGGDRHPGRFLANKTDVPQPEAPVNLLHLDDCVAIIAQLIASPPLLKEVFQVAADQHPTRREFYTAAAKTLGLVLPQFALSAEKKFKIITNHKLKAALSYEFIHPDPMLFF